MKEKSKLILALDVDNPSKAIELVEELSPYVAFFKIGLEFINAMLSSILMPIEDKKAINNTWKIRELFRLLKGKIMWDGKFHDIPNTMAGATKVIAGMGVEMFTIHASAGLSAIEKTVANKGDALVLGVTVLTSISEEECISIFGSEPGAKVVEFAKMLVKAGADGIVCSSKELRLLQSCSEFDNLIKVVPGTRSSWALKNDQKRVTTPPEALIYGANFLVMGRQLRSPPKEIGTPKDAAEKTLAEIRQVF